MLNTGSLTRAAGVALLLAGTVTPAGLSHHPRFRAFDEQLHWRGRSFFVAPHGLPDNDGTLQQALDLATALSEHSPAKPGDTIWLRGGIYPGSFTSELKGSPNLPIVIRQYPGERATLDGRGVPYRATLTIKGTHAWYWGFEVVNSDPLRVMRNPDVPITRGTGIDVLGPYTKLINLVVHDANSGIGAWSVAEGAELYGNIAFNNGMQGVTRGQGHNLYIQNRTATKWIKENIFFNAFGAGIHAYADEGYIDNLHFEGNVSFNHGLLTTVGADHFNMLVGGGRVARNTTLIDNYAYYSPGVRGSNAEIGYRGGCQDAAIKGNHFVGGLSIVLTRCDSVNMLGNQFYGQILPDTPTRFPDNIYSPTEPQDGKVIVRPHFYESGRAHIVVFNPQKRPEIDATEAGKVLNRGDRYEIRDVQNYFGPPLLADTYSPARRIVIPMTDLPTSPPIGDAEGLPHTAPAFGVFVLLKIPAASELPH